MYTERLKTLQSMHANAVRANQAYTEAKASVNHYRQQISYIRSIFQGLKVLDNLIATQETEWKDDVLRTLEADIMEALAFVYPSDGYTVKLDSRVLRNKMHIESMVSSYFTGDMAGDVSDSQGRLFQQIVSFAALGSVMLLLGVDTVYIDEAFSGSAKRNVEKVNALLRHMQKKGLNIILIAQDVSMANGIDANVLFLERSLDNKTTITQGG